jgi:iron uptake system EfeUOB component EfeO/EfeM
MLPYREALDCLRRGDWQAAHEIVQALDDPLAYRMHAAVHRLEGDLSNAKYWYRKARLNIDLAEPIEQELGRIDTLIQELAQL